MNARFPLLSTLSVLLRFFGAAAVLVGAAGLLDSHIDFLPRTLAHELQGWRSVAVLGAGCLSLALGETIGVFFAIEQNTRALANAWTREASRNGRTPQPPGENVDLTAPAPIYRCAICAAEYTVRAHLWRHLRAAHRIADEEIDRHILGA